MSILKVARIGHPVLRAPALAVAVDTLRSAQIQRFIDDMIETMHEYNGVGVAAPQVHVSLRIAVIEVPPDDERTGGGVPLMVLANPVISPLSEERAVGWEGCLSVPDLRGEVPRFTRLKLEALDREGKSYVVEASDFFARVIQHECDHLEGSVYLDRMDDMRSLTFMEEFDRFGRPQQDGG